MSAATSKLSVVPHESAGNVACWCRQFRGDIETHRAEAEARWIAAGRDPATRCECVPCALHSHSEHEAQGLRAFEERRRAQAHARDLIAVARLAVREHAAITTVPRPEPMLIDADEAARLLGISPDALYQRAQRHQLPPGAVHRTGRRIQFRREKLVSGGRS